MILKCINVSKRIKEKYLLKDVNLNINEGDVIGLIGPNGAGKTTLIKCIVGLQKISSGKIIINDFDLEKDFESSISRVGAIVENPDFYNYMSGYDNLKLKSRIYNVSEKRLNEIITLVGLEKRIKDRVSTYSLGMKQRLGIAYALINNPNLLILDEPTNGLDPEGIVLLKNIIKSGSIIESKNIEKLKNKTDSYLLEVSDTKDINLLFKNNVINENFIKVFCNKEFIPLIVESLVKSNIKIYSIKENKISLEEIFMNKIGGNIID